MVFFFYKISSYNKINCFIIIKNFQLFSTALPSLKFYKIYYQKILYLYVLDSNRGRPVHNLQTCKGYYSKNLFVKDSSSHPSKLCNLATQGLVSRQETRAFCLLLMDKFIRINRRPPLSNLNLIHLLHLPSPSNPQ